MLLRVRDREATVWGLNVRAAVARGMHPWWQWSLEARSRLYYRVPIAAVKERRVLRGEMWCCLVWQEVGSPGAICQNCVVEPIGQVTVTARSVEKIGREPYAETWIFSAYPEFI